MIRFISTTSLTALLILVLYLPSAYPPQSFIDQLRVEHALTVDFWGRTHATRILARMLDWQATARQAAPLSSPATAAVANPVNSAVARQMTEVNHRLLSNPYFHSIDTLLALATYRLSALLEWLPVLLAFTLAALFDGTLVRVIKSKEFLQHDPETFALHVCAAIMTACATVLALVLPVTLHPLAFAAAPLAMSAFASRALADFHRRG